MFLIATKQKIAERELGLWVAL